MQNFKEFLEAKPLYYKEIDHTRVHKAYSMLKPHIKRPKTIHIVGTNGKGSTGRVLAHLLSRSEKVVSSSDKNHTSSHTPTSYLLPPTYLVGHYSSPHILEFNERIWIDGSNASDEVLQKAHERLYAILGRDMSEALSYFEYTTLLAFVVFEDCEYMVLEAGLGGEFDATNVCDKELSIITPIDIDHQAFLGDTIEQIATTKINSIQSKALISKQPHQEVYEVAKDIASQKNATLYITKNSAHPRYKELQAIAKNKGWASYLVDNATLAIEALEILKVEYDLDALNSLELFGRYYPLASNIRIDVGHNPLAAKVLKEAITTPVVLIYNSLDDKDYKQVLSILKPKLKRVQIIPIHSQRATTLQAIEDAIKSVGLEYSYFDGKLSDDEEYLVFGSFYVVEEFLKG
jgi:dihydrofolate synthase/folylpolyglutamate synthase